MSSVNSLVAAADAQQDTSARKPQKPGIMHGVAGRTLVATVVVAVVLMLCLVAVIFALEIHRVNPDRSPLFKVYGDVFKTIVAGLVVAMLGVLIPALIGEARYAFERMKESRAAYSNAKTGIDYLKLRLSTMTLAEAALCVQQVHVQKHLAELYDEFVLHLWKRFQGTKTAAMWDDEMYEKLFLTRDILEKEARQWDTLTPEQRVAILNYSLPTEPDGELKKARYQPETS